MRVVIADQNVYFLEPFEWFLQTRGHEAATARDGLTCLNALHEFHPDVLAISSNLLWGGSEGVLSVMQEDRGLRNTPVLLLQSESDGFVLRRHPMVVAAARQPFRFEDLACQLNFLAILGADEKCCEERAGNRFVANAISCVDHAIWNA